MNPSSAKILQYLAGQSDLDAIQKEELQKQAEEHPYFAVSQFLLTKKLHSLADEGFLQQAQKTALYFSNPLWLHYKLTEQAIEQNTTEFYEQFAVSSNDATSKQPVEAPLAPLPSVENEAENEAEKQRQPDELEHVDQLPRNEQVEEVEIAAGTKSIDQQDELNETAARIYAEDQGPITQEADTLATEIIDDNASDGDFPVNTFEESARSEVVTAAETLQAEPTVEEVVNTVDREPLLNNQEFTAGELQANETSAPAIEDEHELMFRNIKAMLDASSEEADADVENSSIPIDPYFTIDYFASQGIKLDLDSNPKDQLGKQVKKFTQWLRHMKKLGPEDATETISRNETDSKVEQFADSSNTVREVVTEAMAQVLEKQGKKEKAIELYNKLSFLNTDKSAYFAAKIENLKGS